MDIIQKFNTHTGELQEEFSTYKSDDFNQLMEIISKGNSYLSPSQVAYALGKGQVIHTSFSYFVSKGE
jgi:hypothetical protein